MILHLALERHGLRVEKHLDTYAIESMRPEDEARFLSAMYRELLRTLDSISVPTSPDASFPADPHAPPQSHHGTDDARVM
jgi:hypothetical protein